MNAIHVFMLAVMPVIQIDPLTHVMTVGDELHNPSSVAVMADGTVLVADLVRDHIARFDSAGALIGTWPIPEGPIAVAVHPTNGGYYVALRDEGTVGIYTYDSDSDTLVRSVPGSLGEGNPLVEFIQPTDIDIASDTGRIYVVDGGGDRVYGFESNGDLALMFGQRGEMTGQFLYPSAIAVDEGHSRLIVADQDNFRIQVFSTSGLFEDRFGYRNKYLVGGGQEGWMPRTQGLAVDAEGHIYVADAFMSSVRVFDTAGTELGKVVEFGSGPGDLRAAYGLALNGDDSRLYVISVATSSVEVYVTPDFAAPSPAGTAGVQSGADATAEPGTNWCKYDALRIRANGDGGNTLDLSGRRRDWEARRNRAQGNSNLLPTPATAQVGYEGPHFIEATIICGRCHGIGDQPGGHEGLTEGQVMICMSCHSGDGQALKMPVGEQDVADPYGTNPSAADGRGRSHAWGVPAVNALADSVGPAAGSELERYLDESGNIKCSTCHDQHTSDSDAPYLRAANYHDQMCKQCHAARDVGPGEGGSHAVGFDYPGGVGEFPADGAVLPLMLKDGNVECLTCHGIHNADSGGANSGAGDGMLLRGPNDETFCQTCHTEHIGHTPGGDWQPTCNDCHDVHDPPNANLSLVRSAVHNQTLAADKTVVFTSRSGANSFDDGEPSENDGICQVCHTDTNYHMHDGTGTSHNDGTTCTDCHPHAAGFMPTGGDCTSCHASAMDNGDGVPAGGRRPVVGEFPIDDAHAHYGAELDNDDCTVCHDLTTHMNGYVELSDPDGGPLYSFIRPEDLTSSPDLSDFCQGCHDSDGATRLVSPLDPFGNGNAPPDVAIKFSGTLQWDQYYGGICWADEGTFRPVNSHHDIGDTDQATSGAKIECLSCHGAHTAAASQPASDPYATNTPWLDSSTEFCLACHRGGDGPLDPIFPAGVWGPVVDVNDPRWELQGIDWCETLEGACLTGDCSSLRGMDSNDYVSAPWYTDYSWTHAAHGLDSKRGWNGYSGAQSYNVACTACHDPHGSYTPTNTAGNPYMIRDQVDGTMYIDDGVEATGFNGPPFESYGIARDVVISVTPISPANPNTASTLGWGGTEGLCNVCHIEWLDAGWFHSWCDDCQTCHGHGMAWGESDSVDWNDDSPSPLNDSCLRSTRLTVGTSITADNAVADSDAAPFCGTDSPTQGLWYRVLGTGTTLTATTCSAGTDFDTAVQVFCDCQSLNCVAGNDDDPSCGLAASNSTVSWCSDPDQVYYIHVGGSGAASGVFELGVTEDGATCTPPDGSCQPEIGACCVGELNVENDTKTECDGLGGDWYADQNCESFNCPPLGACCLTDACQATNTEAQCVALGGTWTSGQTCPEFTCPAPGPSAAGDHSSERSVSKPSDGRQPVPFLKGEWDRPLHRVHSERSGVGPR